MAVLREGEVFAKINKQGRARKTVDAVEVAKLPESTVGGKEYSGQALVDGLPAWNLLPPQQVVRRRRG